MTSRREFLTLTGAGAASLVGVQTVRAAGDRFSPVVTASKGWVNYSIPEEAVRYGADGYPSFIVEFEAGEGDTLSSWADETDQRMLVDRTDAHNRATVAAPMSDVLPTMLDSLMSGQSALENLDYVRSVSFNQRLSVPDPVGPLMPMENAEDPSPWYRWSLRDNGWTTEGVAYQADAPEADMARVRELVGIESSSPDGTGGTIAILDTGLTYSEAVHGDAIVAGKNFLDDTTTDTASGDYEAIRDGSGHGSWCAGAIHDLAPGADLAIGKVLGDDGSGSTPDILAGLDWAVEQNVGVISMSLGSPLYTKALADRITALTEEEDILVVVAAGNSRQTVRWVASPADTKSVLAVAATNAVDHGEMASAYFSQVGPDSGVLDKSNGATDDATVDVSAPGMNVAAPVQGGTETLSGTSMATPEVAAVATILRAERSLTAKKAHDRLIQTATRLPKAGETEVGGGCVDLEAALANTEREKTQAETANETAQGRDAFNRGLSGNYGSVLGSLF